MRRNKVHKFLRAVGFSNIRKKDLEIILDEIVEHPETMRITKDSEGSEFTELTKTFGDGVGIMVRGFYDENDIFQTNYYVPFSSFENISTQEQIDIEKHAEKESYAGVCDEVRVGVTLIFYLQNVADFLAEYRTNIHTKNVFGAKLSALSVEGKILLPIQQKVLEKQIANSKQEKRKQLIAEAREGNEEAIENLSIQDLDTYSQLSKRIRKEDVFSMEKILSAYYYFKSTKNMFAEESHDYEATIEETTYVATMSDCSILSGLIGKNAILILNNDNDIYNINVFSTSSYGDLKEMYNTYRLNVVDIPVDAHPHPHPHPLSEIV